MHVSLVCVTNFNLFTQVVCVNESLQYMSYVYVVKMDELKYHAVIKFFVLDELTRKEIHPKLSRVYGSCAS